MHRSRLTVAIQQNVRPQHFEARAPDLLERDLDFLLHDGDGALGARQSERGHTIEGCAAKEHEFRPECERDHDVRPAAEADTLNASTK